MLRHDLKWAKVINYSQNPGFTIIYLDAGFTIVRNHHLKR